LEFGDYLEFGICDLGFYTLGSVPNSAWKSSFVQIVTVPIPLNLPDGDANAAPSWTSLLNQGFRSKKL
jgi:hypothetical protein